MQPDVIYVLAGLAVVVVILAVLFRSGTIKVALEALGAKASVEGRGGDGKTKGASSKTVIPPAPGVSAGGDGAVAIGGSANQAKIDAGIRNEARRPKP